MTNRKAQAQMACAFLAGAHCHKAYTYHKGLSSTSTSKNISILLKFRISINSYIFATIDKIHDFDLLILSIFNIPLTMYKKTHNVFLIIKT